MRRIRVLLLLDEAWNDKLYGNSNMTNWFSGFANVEIANIYCSPELPDNHCCTKYYQITDGMMLNSILHGRKAGKAFTMQEAGRTALTPGERKTALDRLKGIRTETMRMGRDMLWLMGKYDKDGLKAFVDAFHPDLIFSLRRGSVKLCRLERLLKNITGLPIIAFTGDNEREDGVFSASPVAWIRTAMVRRALDKTIPLYSHYYTGSREQAEFYHNKYGVPTSLVFKCGEPDADRIHREVHSPIRLVYAGKLYCGRWKTLAVIAEALKTINSESVKMELDIYTRDQITDEQQKALNDGKNSFIRGAVTPDQVFATYRSADIALHVESFDRKNRAVTRHSYSTKVVDLLASGCAVMAIGWEKHSACIELKRNDAAIVITDLEQISKKLSELAEHPDMILEYAQKAEKELEENHSKKKVQQQFYNDFMEAIGK